MITVHQTEENQEEQRIGRTANSRKPTKQKVKRLGEVPCIIRQYQVGNNEFSKDNICWAIFWGDRSSDDKDTVDWASPVHA